VEGKACKTVFAGDFYRSIYGCVDFISGGYFHLPARLLSIAQKIFELETVAICAVANSGYAHGTTLLVFTTQILNVT
jgi:hypothetical protein